MPSLHLKGITFPFFADATGKVVHNISCLFWLAEVRRRQMFKNRDIYLYKRDSMSPNTYYGISSNCICRSKVDDAEKWLKT